MPTSTAAIPFPGRSPAPVVVPERTLRWSGSAQATPSGDYGWRVTPDLSSRYARTTPKLNFTPDRAVRFTLDDRLPELEPSILPDRLYDLGDKTSDELVKAPTRAAISEVIEMPVDQIANFRQPAEDKDGRRRSRANTSGR